jgi:hypothetical protein
MPQWLIRAVYDFIVTAIAGVLALNIAIPGSLAEAEAQASVIGVAIARVVLTAAGVAITTRFPEFAAWLHDKLGVQDS